MKTLFKFRIFIVILIVIIFVCLDMYRNRGVQFIRKPNYLSKEEIDSRVNEYFNRHMTKLSGDVSQARQSPEFKKRKEEREKKKQELLKEVYASQKREEQEETLLHIEELIIEEFSENE